MQTTAIPTEVQRNIDQRRKKKSWQRGIKMEPETEKPGQRASESMLFSAQRPGHHTER